MIVINIIFAFRMRHNLRKCICSGFVVLLFRFSFRFIDKMKTCIHYSSSTYWKYSHYLSQLHFHEKCGLFAEWIESHLHTFQIYCDSKVCRSRLSGTLLLCSVSRRQFTVCRSHSHFYDTQFPEGNLQSEKVNLKWHFYDNYQSADAGS